MRVGVYVDGFNLEFGGRAVCGADEPGWRWLDIGRLSDRLAATRWAGMCPRVERVVYCTARLSGPAARAQDVYLRGLLRTGSVDHVELGQFVTRVRTSPLAAWTDRGRPRVVTSRWPLQVQDRAGADVADATFIVSHLHREEKGSDVNVATHLLVDVLQGAVDAVIVITNDGDLALPLRVARASVPVGTVNPGRKRPAGKLRGAPDEGAGGHWWTRLDPSDYHAAQLPGVVGRLCRPEGWWTMRDDPGRRPTPRSISPPAPSTL